MIEEIKTPETIRRYEPEVTSEHGSLVPIMKQSIDGGYVGYHQYVKLWNRRATASEGAWLPIESAPKDGSGFVGYSPTHGIKLDVRWSPIRNDFDLHGWSCLSRNWTHWQPALKPPTTRAEDELKGGKV